MAVRSFTTAPMNIYKLTNDCAHIPTPLPVRADRESRLSKFILSVFNDRSSCTISSITAVNGRTPNSFSQHMASASHSLNRRRAFNAQ